MKTKIKILNSDGLRQTEILFNKIKHLPHYNKIPARVKAWLKVRTALDDYDEVLIATQENEPSHFFDYNAVSRPECGREGNESSRLNRGLCMIEGNE